jgi:hypothetical protein
LETALSERVHGTPAETKPNAPGLWVHVTHDGTRRTVKVKAQNDELYAVVGGTFACAIPVSELPGIWSSLELR